MFSKNSRYAGIEQADVTIEGGRQVRAVKIRRLPPTEGEPVSVTPPDRLDILAGQRYGDATRFWHIADANTELEARALIEGAPKEIMAPE